MAKTYDKETAWMQYITIDKVVDMYECPDCGFEYNAGHELDTEEGGYDCPMCENLELEKENARLRKALEFYGNDRNYVKYRHTDRTPIGEDRGRLACRALDESKAMQALKE